MTEKLYYKYWGKASSDNDSGASYHLLPYHCLDVAAVADQWWLHSSSLRRQFNWGMVKKMKLRKMEKIQIPVQRLES